MAISATEIARIVQELSRDADATLGPGSNLGIENEARHHAKYHDHFALKSYRQEVVDAVQQAMHDDYTDTTWPRCPNHPNHPLWLHDEYWTCERDNTPIAKLGQLASIMKPYC